MGITMSGLRMYDRVVDHVLTWSELVLGIGGIVVGLLYAVKRVYNMARNVESVLEQVGRSWNLAQKLDERIDGIEKQLHPNGGDSMRDAVHRIEDRLALIEHRCATASCRLDK